MKSVAGQSRIFGDAHEDVAPPYIARRHRFEVSERVDPAGEVITPLDEDEARRIAKVI